MYRQHSNDFHTRPVTPVPSLRKSDNISPATTSTRSPITPTTDSHLIQYITVPLVIDKSALLLGSRNFQKKLACQHISELMADKPLPSLPSDDTRDPEDSFLEWDSSDDESGSKRMVKKVKQALKHSRKPAAQTYTFRPKVLPYSPDNVQNATPRPRARPKITRLQTNESIAASLKSTIKQTRDPTPLAIGTRPKPRDLLPSTRTRPAPIKIVPDKALPTTVEATQPRPRQSNATSKHTSYRHSYDETSAVDSTFAALRQLADQPRPSHDHRREMPSPATTTRHMPLPARPDLSIKPVPAFLANEASEFTPPDTPTSTSSTKPKRFQRLFRNLRERTSFRELRRGST